MTRRRILGVLAALVSVAIWANFMITTGDAMDGRLTLPEVGLLRGVVSAGALLPVIWRIGFYPKGLAPWRFAAMVVGLGAAFLYLMPGGLAYAPPAASGIFGPGLAPFWAALLSVIFLKERLGPIRVFGIVLITAGVLGVGGVEIMRHAGDSEWIGYLLFAAGSLSFSVYAVAQQGSGLSALQATAVVSFWTLPAAGAVALYYGVDYGGIGAEALAWNVATQFASSVVAIVAFTFAANTLGASRAAAFIALTPVVIAVASDVALDKPASPLVWAGVAVVSAGVLIASGVFERRRRPVAA